MTHNNKSFRYVLIGQTFDNIDGRRYEKISSQAAKPFAGGKAIRCAGSHFCRKVSRRYEKISSQSV